MSPSIEQLRSVANRGDDIVTTAFDKNFVEHATAAKQSFKSKVVYFLSKVKYLNRLSFVRKNIRKDWEIQAGVLRAIAYTYGQDVSSQVQNELKLAPKFYGQVTPLKSRTVGAALDLAKTKWEETRGHLKVTPFDPEKFDVPKEAKRLKAKYPVVYEEHLQDRLDHYALNRKFEGMSRFLTPDQFVALTLYTSSLYKVVNSNLRSGTNTERWQDFIKDAQDAIRILEQANDKFKPEETSPLYRGLKLTRDLPIHPDNLKEGESITDKTFTSTTRDLDEAEDFAAIGSAIGEGEDYQEAPGDEVIQYIFGKTGADIDNISTERYESEVVFKPETEFKVLFKHYDAKHKVYRLVLEEADQMKEAGRTGLADALLDAPVKKP